MRSTAATSFALLLISFSGPILTQSAQAATAGPPADRFAPTWSSISSVGFAPGAPAPRMSLVATKPGIVADALVSDAIASAADPSFRRELAIDEMATGWRAVQRAALEDLRDALRRYGASTNDDVRGARFAALLRRLVDGSGRSIARDGDDADLTLGAVFDRVIRDAPDAALPKIEAAERAWTAYRDAFERFAEAMDRKDAMRGLHDDLARDRTVELEADPTSTPAK